MEILAANPCILSSLKVYDFQTILRLPIAYIGGAISDCEFQVADLPMAVRRSSLHSENL